jgi:serine/threonine-protein kinase HipA
MKRRLIVGLDFGSGPRTVGQLGWDDTARQAVLEWDPGFAADPVPLSPLMVQTYRGLLRPQDRAFDGLPGFIGDSLPDGWGRLLMDRAGAAQGLSAMTDLVRLAMVGRHGMGALTYEPAAVTGPDDLIDLDWFARLVPDVESGIAIVELDRLRGMAGGSQGARPKFVAQLAPDGQLHSHRRATLAGWRPVLIKGRSSADPAGSVEAEAAYARMARAAGIAMMPVEVIGTTRHEPFLVTDRFDRAGAGRLHMQTAAALLNVDFRRATMDYAEVLKLVSVMTRDQRAVEQMYHRMVFNVRAWNRDDHLKNHAFLMGQGGDWHLAPAYDLTYSAGPGGEHALLIGGEGRRPGPVAMALVAARAGIKAGRAQEIIARVDAAIAQWPVFAAMAEVPPTLSGQITAALATAAAWD